MTIGELIAKLEAASGPSRELDAEIAALCAPTDDPRLAAFESGDDYPRTYTDSIDAALSLVPEGNFWEVGADENKTMAFAAVMPPEEAWSSCNAPTPALALCIAALRARARAASERG